MGIFEAQLISLAEALAERLIGHLVSQLELKLGLNLPIPPQAILTPQFIAKGDD